MSFQDAFILALPGTLIAIYGLYLQFKREKNIPRVNASEAMLHDAERQRIEDEITERVLVRARAELDRMAIVMNDVIKGAWILHAQVKEQGGEPRYTPPKKYETGPMGKVAA